MTAPKIKTSKQITPMIYAYTTPEIQRHNGWIKIGYTEQDVHTRIRQQTRTADIQYCLEWQGTAVFDDGSGETFKDTDFHTYLRKNGIEQGIDEDTKKFTEWLHISPQNSKYHFYDFKSNRGILSSLTEPQPYSLREEQERAVSMTLDYCRKHPNSEFLWNAKPRFGKTLTAYELIKRMNAKKVLIVTNRPAISNSWYDDYEKFLGTQSGYYFVSNTDSLKNKRLVLSREKFLDFSLKTDTEYPFIEFVSLQDLKGAEDFGGDHKKLTEIKTITWDILIVDEAHEGIETYKTDIAFDRITRNFTLHLSGTPFKALAKDKFPDGAVFSWTYADEQRRKRNWDTSQEQENPYLSLPKLHLFTYRMSEIVRDKLKRGIDIDGETEDYAFDLNEFFATRNGKFIYETSVDRFLDALATQPKFPFSTEELRNELKHTFWLLNRVDSVLALKKKLDSHPVFSEYKVIAAVGNGKTDDTDDTESIKNNYKKVVEAIANNPKTITLSVGQLTTGVTIPEWTAVLMLSNMQSPSLYMQAAFRSQNPSTASASIVSILQTCLIFSL